MTRLSSSPLASILMAACSLGLLPGGTSPAADALEKQASWEAPNREAAVGIFVAALQQQGVETETITPLAEAYAEAIADQETDRLAAFIELASGAVPPLAQLQRTVQEDPLGFEVRQLDALRDSL